MPYYPGWRATVDGNVPPVARVDLALMGVVVPPGDRELRLSFGSNSFRIGSALTLAGLVLASLLVAGRPNRLAARPPTAA